MTANGSLVGGAGHAAARAVVVPVVQRSWDHPEEHPSDQGVWRYAIVFVNFEAKQVTYIGAHQHDQGCVRAIKVTGGGGGGGSPNLRTCASFLLPFYQNDRLPSGCAALRRSQRHLGLAGSLRVAHPTSHLSHRILRAAGSHPNGDSLVDLGAFF